MELSGRGAVAIGEGGGIGRLIAHALAEAALFIGDIDAQAAGAVADG